MKRSVAGICVRAGAVFMARRLGGGDLGGKWEFPGGKVEGGESDAQAIRREYLEEFGIEALVGQAIGEVTFRHKDSDFTLAAYFIYLAPELRIACHPEHSEYRWTIRHRIAALDLAQSDRDLLGLF